ncbi:MAG: hypothetical protein OEZ34_14990 [Spirochaetia bacterium]|nr:hypothetical protein [Spirochaetia bacterium]
MKKKQILTLILFLLATFLGYIYIFGESGLIIQDRLKKNLTSLNSQIKELEKENEILNRKIILSGKNSNFAENDELSIRAGKSIILKFENEDPENGRILDSGFEPKLGELRVLYLVTMFFITLVAVTLSVYLSGNRKFANNAESFKI